MFSRCIRNEISLHQRASRLANYPVKQRAAVDGAGALLVLGASAHVEKGKGRRAGARAPGEWEKKPEQN